MAGCHADISKCQGRCRLCPQRPSPTWYFNQQGQSHEGALCPRQVARSRSQMPSMHHSLLKSCLQITVSPERKTAHLAICSVSSLGYAKASQTESMQTPNSLPPANGCNLLLPQSFCLHPSRCSSQKLLVTFNFSLSQYLHQQILSPLCPPTSHQPTATTLASCSRVIPAASRLRALTPHHHLPPVPSEHGRPRSLCKPACGVC